MLYTYKAVVRDNTVEWLEDAPQGFTAGKSVRVLVTVLDDSDVIEEGQGQRMAAALGKATGSTRQADEDAVAWEREARTIRPLSGR